MVRRIRQVLLALLMGVAANTSMKATNVPTISLYDFIQNPGTFAILIQLLSETFTDANVNKYLDPRTLFAPTDNAFKQFGRLGLLDGTANISKRRDFANFLIVQKKLTTADLVKPGAQFTTISGTQISTSQIGKILYTKDTFNGTVVVIDTVPVNPDLKSILYPGGK